MNIWVGKIVGQTGPQWWVQVHDFLPTEEEKLLKRGRLVATVSLHHESAIGEIEMVAQGREVLSRLQELYYGETAAPVLEQLKKATLSVVEEFGADSGTIELNCLAMTDQAVYMVATSGGIWVQVPGREGWLRDPQQGHPTQVLSGKLSEGQTVVVGNTNFWQGLPLGIIKASLDNEDHDTIVETLGSVVFGNQKLQGAVGAVIKVGLGEAVIPETLEPEEVEGVVMPPVVARPVDQPVLPAATDRPSARSWGPLRMRVEKLLTRLPTKPHSIYIGSPETKRKRTMYVGVAFLVLLLVLVGGWQVRKQHLGQYNSELDGQIEALMYKYREAEALTELNPARSRQLLAEAQEEVRALNELSGSKKDSRLVEIEQGLPAVLGAATGTKSPEPAEVLNLDLVRSGMTGALMRVSEQGLVVLDRDGDRIVVVDPGKKSGDVVAGKDGIGEAVSLATYPGKLEVLSDKGIVECSAIGAECTVRVEADGWGSIADMGMFGGNIYVLDNTAIWRHQVTDTGFSSKQAWLADTESPDFTTATGMAIDGSIWVAKTGGEIEKYTRGVKDSFIMEDLDVALGAKVAIFTTEDSEKLYVLDAQNARVVVFAKTGEYDSQYNIEVAKDAVAIVADEQAGNLYLLAGSKIWVVKL